MVVGAGPREVGLPDSMRRVPGGRLQRGAVHDISLLIVRTRNGMAKGEIVKNAAAAKKRGLVSFASLRVFFLWLTAIALGG